MTIKPIFAWYDMWIGAYYDKRNRRLYVLPIPCFGIVIQFAFPLRERIQQKLEEKRLQEKSGFGKKRNEKPLNLKQIPKHGNNINEKVKIINKGKNSKGVQKCRKEKKV